MARARTLKARAHHGARSLDLTIPTDVCERFGIRPGDVFSLAADKHDGRLVLKYVRVYPE